MKKIFLSFLLFVASAFGIILEWDRNPETSVAGYRIYTGRQSRVYDSALDVGNQTMAELATQPGTTYYAVTAYDTEGLESDFSDEVYFTPPLTPYLVWAIPAGLHLLESCTDLTGAVWVFQAIVTGPFDYLITVDPAEPRRFYRYTVQ